MHIVYIQYTLSEVLNEVPTAKSANHRWLKVWRAAQVTWQRRGNLGSRLFQQINDRLIPDLYSSKTKEEKRD